MGICPKTYHVDAWIYVKYGLEELIVAHNKIAIFFLDNKQKKIPKPFVNFPWTPLFDQKCLLIGSNRNLHRPFAEVIARGGPTFETGPGFHSGILVTNGWLHVATF